MVSSRAVVAVRMGEEFATSVRSLLALKEYGKL